METKFGWVLIWMGPDGVRRYPSQVLGNPPEERKEGCLNPEKTSLWNEASTLRSNSPSFQADARRQKARYEQSSMQVELCRMTRITFTFSSTLQDDFQCVSTGRRSRTKTSFYKRPETRSNQNFWNSSCATLESHGMPLTVALVSKTFENPLRYSTILDIIIAITCTPCYY